MISSGGPRRMARLDSRSSCCHPGYLRTVCLFRDRNSGPVEIGRGSEGQTGVRAIIGRRIMVITRMFPANHERATHIERRAGSLREFSGPP